MIPFANAQSDRSGFYKRGEGKEFPKQSGPRQWQRCDSERPWDVGPVRLVLRICGREGGSSPALWDPARPKVTAPWEPHIQIKCLH